MKDQTVGPYTRETTVDPDARVHVGGGDDRVPVYNAREGEWAVWLPHDCDEWVVAAGTREHVAEQVQLLIDSLSEALARLSSETTT